MRKVIAAWVFRLWEAEWLMLGVLIGAAVMLGAVVWAHRTRRKDGGNDR